MRKIIVLELLFVAFLSFHFIYASPSNFQSNDPFSLAFHRELNNTNKAIPDSNVTFINRWGYGPNYAVFANPPYAYIGNGTVFQILDISNLNNPTLLNEIETPGIIDNIYVSNGYAFLAFTTTPWQNNLGLYILDLSDPTNPQPITQTNLGINVFVSFYVSGNILYACDYSTIFIIDISNIYNTTVIGSHTILPAILTDLEVQNNYLYVANRQNAFHIIDISNPSNPVEVSTVNTSGLVRGIDIYGNYAVLAEGSSGIEIYDITNPTNPILLGNFDTEGYAYDVAISGDYVYVADGRNGLRVVSISNPQVPQGIGQINTYTHPLIGSGANKIYKTQSSVFVADRFNGLHIIDVNNPYNPSELSHFETMSFAYDFKLDGNFGYLIDGAYGLVKIDLTNPNQPVILDHLNPTTWGYSRSVKIHGNYLFVSCGTGGVRIIDKTTFSEISAIDVGAYVYNVTISLDGNYLFIPSQQNGLKIYNISNIQYPTLVGEYPAPPNSYFFDVVIHDQEAYLSDFNGSYFALDISDLSNPVFLDSIKTSNYGGNYLALKYPYLFAADGEKGIRIFDISNPSDIVLTNSINFNGWSWNVQIFNNYMTICDDYDRGVSIYDISDPINPNFIGSYRTIGTTKSAYLSSNYLYVAASNSGFYILRVNDLTDIQEPSEKVFLDKFQLYQNYPNPFNPETHITYQLPERSEVRLEIYNTLGQKVRTLVQGLQDTGIHTVVWDGRDEAGRPAASGVYLYVLQAGKYRQTRKMILMK